VHFIFTGVYKDAVQSYLKNIGYVLRQQCDPDMPHTFFPSRYFYKMLMTMMTIVLEKWHMK